MRKGRQLGLSSILWLAIGLIVASIVLGGGALHWYWLYQGERQAEGLRARAIAEAYASQVATLLATGNEPAVRAFVKDLAVHPSTSLVAILDRQNRTLASKGKISLIESFLESAGSGDGSRTWQVGQDLDEQVLALGLAAVPIMARGSDEPVGTLVYAARLSSYTGISHTQTLKFLACLGLIAATGMILGLLWLRERVLRPLARLSSRPPKSGVDDAVASLLTSRNDEIGSLARMLDQMRRDVDEWRGRASYLERSFDDRVAAKTRRITREMRMVEKEIWVDPLTRLGNRRLMEDKFDEVFRAQYEAHQDLSIVMIDVDNFKALNDTLGHKAGDELLVLAGELLKQCVREQDLAIRYGGDEFILILPAVSSADSGRIAERMIKLFNQQARVLNVDPKPTVSAGIASLWDHQPRTSASILKLADDALYEAKKAGKSRVHVLKPKRTAPVPEA